MFRKRFIGLSSDVDYGKPTKRSWRNFRSIRVLDPRPSDWILFARRSGKYFIVPDGVPIDPKARRFSILDAGDIKEPGIQGLAFNRGFYKPFLPIFSEDELSGEVPIERPGEKFTTQAIVVEIASIGYRDGDPPESFIEKFLSKYEKDSIEFINKEFAAKRKLQDELSKSGKLLAGSFGVVTTLAIIAKGTRDFKIEFT